MGNHESQNLLVFNGNGRKRHEYGRCERSLLFKSPTFGLRKSSNDHIL
jgi:hypothetical protein